MAVDLLDRPTLVLNRQWQPVGVAPVRRSLTLLCNDSAHVIDPEDYRLYSWSDWARQAPREGEPFLQAITFRMRVPEVLALIRYDRNGLTSVTFSRRNIFKRDHWACQYCGIQPGSEELTIDHVLPRSLGGRSNWENCVLACVPCNARKANRTPELAGMRLRRPPFRPRWRPLYAEPDVPVRSWSRFLSEAYWRVSLDESP